MLVLEHNCSAVWCSAADSQLKILDLCRVVRSASFLAGGVLECNLAIDDLVQRFKMQSNQMHALCGALSLPYMCRRVLRVVLWLLIGPRLQLLAAEPLMYNAEHLCLSHYPYVTRHSASLIIPM